MVGVLKVQTAPGVWEPVVGPVGGSGLDQATADARYVNMAGDTMTGLLTLSGPPTAALHAATKTYVDARLLLAGGTLTGFLTLHAAPTAVNHAATKAYVDAHADTRKYDKTGGPISGNVSIAGTLSTTNAITVRNAQFIPTMSLYLSQAQDRPAIQFINWTTSVPIAEVGCLNDDLWLNSYKELFIKAQNRVVGGFIGTGPILAIGKGNLDSAVPGVEIYAGGNGLGRMSSTASHVNSYANLICRHVGGTTGMDAEGKVFVLFQRGGVIGDPTSVKVVGSITQVATSGTKYNQTSDYRIKNDLGPITDVVSRVMALAPKHLQAKEDLFEFDGFIAHEVQAVVPDAVTGEKDAVLPLDDEFNPGGPDLQQLDMARLIPLLTAGLQDALTRIATLEAAP